MLWNTKGAIIPIVVGTLETIPQDLGRGQEELEIGGRIETIQTTVLIRLTGILKIVLET